MHKKQCRRLASVATSTDATYAGNSGASSTAARSGGRASETADDSDDVVTFDDYEDEHMAKINYIHPLSECKVLENKGRSLIAVSHMYIGAHPLNPENTGIDKYGRCAPLVPPVLIASQRKSRCAYCFKKLEQTSTNTSLLHHHCSNKCKDMDGNQSVEENGIRMIRMVFPNVELPSPTIVLASRILRYSVTKPTVAREFDELCYNIDDLSEQEKKEYLQTVKNCHSLLWYMGAEREASKEAEQMMANPNEAYKFMSRITMNGFTVSTSEQEGIGFGIYTGASMINHSCRPNAVQTFHFSSSEGSAPDMPMLQITTCQQVRAGEEITISYCDVSAPTHYRRRELSNGYKFECDCFWCKDVESNKKLLGLKCPISSCKNDSIVITDNCTATAFCNKCDFKPFEAFIEDHADRVRSLEKQIQCDSYGNDIGIVERVGKRLKREYGDMKDYCSTESSWYLAWCADAFINWSVNAFVYFTNERKQEQICIEALRVIDESRVALCSCFKYPGGLKWYTLQATEAKLRLFANYEDMEAFNMLWEARRYLSLFLPDDDYLIQSIDESTVNCGYMNKFDWSDPLVLDHSHLPEQEVRNLWIINECQDYSADPNKDYFLYRHLED